MRTWIIEPDGTGYASIGGPSTYPHKDVKVIELEPAIELLEDLLRGYIHNHDNPRRKAEMLISEYRRELP